MKRNSATIITSLVLILAILAFMAYDFFISETESTNKYEYKLDNFMEVDNSLINYQETNNFTAGVQKMKGLAVDIYDRIYVAGDTKIAIFNSDGYKLKDIITNSIARCIVVDTDGTIYLGTTDQLIVYDSTGKIINVWEPVNNKSVITSIAVDNENVFVADAGNKVIYRYNKSGELILEIGRKDLEKGIKGFVIPSPYFDLAIGRTGDLWAVNSGMHQFESYDHSGNPISSWKKTSMQLDGFSGCCNPSHFAFLDNGYYVTSEKGIVRIKVHDPSGEFVSVVAASDQFDKGTLGLDLAVDSQGRIIVLDPTRKQVRIYEEK